MKHGEQDRTAAVKEQVSQAGPPKKPSRAGARVAEISGKALGRMIEAFMKLPGIGRKSSERLAFAVLGMAKDEAAEIAQAILDLKNNSRYCAVCNNITEDEICLATSRAAITVESRRAWNSS